MFLQIAIGSAMIVINVMIAGLSAWAMESALSTHRRWLFTEPHRPKLALVLSITLLWAIGMMTVAVWIWAFLFRILGAFDAIEPALYFSLVAFTTLGYGDMVLDVPHRLLGGMEAANGLISIGLVTAMMVEALRHVRQSQISLRPH
jgi:Ion channel